MTKQEKKLCACGCGREIIYKRHHGWKPARYISGHNSKNTGKGWRLNHGYKQIIRRGKNLWKYEHDVVMEEHLGRKLTDNEIVHHINRDKLDNRLENLEVKTISNHMKTHQRKRDKKTGRFLSGEDVLIATI